VVAWNRAVFDMSTRELQAGRMPIMLGGDHCLAIGSIAAVAAHCRATGKKLRVLWLDAHADFNTREITPSGNIHGMPVACLCGLGPTLLTGMAGYPAITPDQICQIGIRSVIWREALVQQRWTSTTCATSTRSACAGRSGALEGVDADTHLQLRRRHAGSAIAPGTVPACPAAWSYARRS
jgi:arginase